MSANGTKIADIIVPAVFNPYVVQRSMELSALVQSGIISNDAALDALATAGGKLINMPFWNDLTGDDENLSDSTPLTPGKITAGQDQAALLMRGKAWQANDLAKALSGDDPMRAIADLVAGFWARKRQTALINILAGVFGSATMAGNVHDVSAASGADTFTGERFIDACQKLGDAKDQLSGIVMHSAVQASLAKQNLISVLKDSDGAPTFPTYMGKRVIVDDGCPVATGVYTTYIFGQGAFGLGNGAAPVPTETDRDSLAGDDILINRQHFILHPRGVKFTASSVAGAAPTNAELATAANWSRVYDNKAIRIVKFVHKIA